MKNKSKILVYLRPSFWGSNSGVFGNFNNHFRFNADKKRNTKQSH